VGYVEHGFGTGALREAVRSHLANPSPYVQSVRPGAPEEGGERLTVITLR
jgi:dsDNA-specific endonuclease/ATPase MutS2